MAKEMAVVWSKPPPGSYKLNIDASFHSDGTGAAGVALRNHKGEAIAGMGCTLDNYLSVATAEATALLKGLEFLENLGTTSVCIESDSLQLIQACNGEVEIRSPYSAILSECFLKISIMQEISFEHCLRDANQVTHQLARNAFISKQYIVWEGDPPVFILSYVLNDVTLFDQ
jgi:ribonuclease HI